MKDDYKHWQITPSQLIAHAIEHANKSTDFDIQMAYLVLDVGIEMILKTFLINFKRDAFRELQNQAKKGDGDIKFYHLVKKVKAVAGNQIQNIPIDNCLTFHDIRNKLYHQGDSIRPTKITLDAYIKLGKQLLKELLDVNVDDSINKNQEVNKESEYTVSHNHWELDRTTESLALELKAKVECIQECSALFTERVRPKYATREFALGLKKIQDEYRYFEYPQLSEYENAENIVFLNNERQKAFNHLTGFEGADIEIMNLIVENVCHFYVRIAIQELCEDTESNWLKYVDAVDLIPELPEKWNWVLKNSYASDELSQQEKIIKEFSETLLWIEFLLDKLYKWIDANVTNIYRPEPNGSGWLTY